MNHLMKIFQEILYLGAVSSILIVLILLIKKVFGKILSPNWHYYIWLLLLIRLLLPYTPESSFSALNLINLAAEQFDISSSVISSPTLNHEQNNDEVSALPGDPILQTNTGDANGTENAIINATAASNHSNPSKQVSLLMILAYVWISGMFLLTIYTIYINLTFMINVRRNYKPIENSRINNILDECKRIIGIKRNITLFTSKRTRTPALYSLFHTKILVSKAYLEQLSDQEIKHIFLHELSHYQRKDIAVNWVLTVLQIVYFFHPLVWFAFYKIHEDCEISCDARALRYLREEEYQGYGSTVIKLIKLFSESNFIPITAGLWKHKSNYRRRIIMISKYKKAKWPNTLFTIILILIIGLIGLTGCKKSADATADTTDNNTEVSTIPTVTIAPTPEITGVPVGDGATEQNDLKQLTGLLGLSKEELISKLGQDYNTVDEGGLEFTKPSIRVWFNDKSITNQVFTNSTEIDFNGAKVGDSISNFKDIFGEPIRENNGEAFFKADNLYLEVYYDTNTEKTYAVYILSEELAVPEKNNGSAPARGSETSTTQASEASTTRPRETFATRTVEGTFTVKVDSATLQTGETYFGDWVIDKVLAYGSAGTYSKEDAEGLIRKSMSFSGDSATCFGDQASYLDNTAKKPKYETAEITSSEFVANYRMTFDDLGITADSVTEVTVSDSKGNGCTFLVKDDKTLIVIGGGTYFELVRKTK